MSHPGRAPPAPHPLSQPLSQPLPSPSPFSPQPLPSPPGGQPRSARSPPLPSLTGKLRQIPAQGAGEEEFVPLTPQEAGGGSSGLRWGRQRPEAPYRCCSTASRRRGRRWRPASGRQMAPGAGRASPAPGQTARPPARAAGPAPASSRSACSG